MNIDQKINKIIFCDSLPEIEKGSDILYIALKPKVYAYLKQYIALFHERITRGSLEKIRNTYGVGKEQYWFC